MRISHLLVVTSLTALLNLAVASVANAQRDPSQDVDKSSPDVAARKWGEGAEKAEQSEDKLYQVLEPLDPSQRQNVITIKGTVLKEDGTPARGSQVWLIGMSRLSGKHSGVSQLAFVHADNEGKFEFWYPFWRELYPQEDETSVFCVVARTRDHILTSNVTLNLMEENRGKKAFDGLELKALAKANYSGLVVDEQDNPIPNVIISPMVLSLNANANEKMSTMSMTMELSDEYRAVTDDNGVFTLVDLPESTAILAKLSTQGSVGRRVQWDTQATPEIRLAAGGTVRGKIVNLPTADFHDQVEIELSSARERWVDRSKKQFSFKSLLRPRPDGHFEFADVPPGKYELKFAATNPSVMIAPALLRPVQFESRSGQATDEIQIALPVVIMGHGRIVDDQSGEPVAGAVVTFLSEQDRRRTLLGTATTDAHGVYRGYVEWGKIAIEPGRSPEGYLSPLHMGASQAIEYTKDFEAPTLKYERAITFRGTVVDAERRPVAGAEIQWFQPQRKGQRLPRPVTTDEAGRFEIPQVDPHDALPIRVRSPKGTSSALVVHSGDLSDPSPILVSPENEFRMKGTLIDQRGKPIADAKVNVHWHRRLASAKRPGSGLRSAIETIQANDQGHFESSAFWETDEYHLEIEADGYSKTDLPLVKGEAGRTYDYGTVGLKSNGQTITGKVVDAGGKPISNVAVYNSGDAADIVSSLTDEKGQFRLTGLQDGPVSIFAEHADYRMTGIFLADPAKEVLLSLIPLTAPPAKRQPVDREAIDAVRKKSVDELTEWIKERNLPYKPNLRDSNLNALARRDPDEALMRIESQSVEMEQRSAILIARSMAPIQPRKPGAGDPNPATMKTALRFVERAASRIGNIGGERQYYLQADTGLMFLRLGATDQGKTLIEQAEKGFSESKGPGEYLAVNIAKGLAWYDISRALSYREKVHDENTQLAVRKDVILEVSRYDVPRALELLNDPSRKPTQDQYDDMLRFELAYRIGAVEPQIAAELVRSIVNSRNKSEAAGWAALSVADTNPTLAISLIDQGIDNLRANRRPGPKSFYYPWAPGAAANLAVQAAQVNHPDMESVIQKVLSMRIPMDSNTMSTNRLQASVSMALYLAFINPTIAKQLLANLEPELSDQVLGNGGVGNVSMNQWLCAWVVADPDKAVMLLKAEMEKVREGEKPPYWIEAAYTLLALPASEQLDFVRKYGNAGLQSPSLE